MLNVRLKLLPNALLDGMPATGFVANWAEPVISTRLKTTVRKAGLNFILIIGRDAPLGCVPHWGYGLGWVDDFGGGTGLTAALMGAVPSRVK